MSVGTAFGVSRFLEEPDRAELIEFLRAAWVRQFGAEPDDLNADLALLRRWFRPELTARGARKELATLPPSARKPPVALSGIGFLVVSTKQGLVTPEGRALLWLLESEGGSISDKGLLDAHAKLTEFYGGPYRERLTTVLRGGDIRPNTLGFVLFLLLNGSIGRADALELPSEPEHEQQLAGAIAQVLDAFVDGLGSKRLGEKERARLRSNWALTEASAQLPELVEYREGAYWLREDAVQTLPEQLGELLAARRNSPASEEIEVVLDSTLSAYKSIRPTLAALNLAHDRPNRARSDLGRIASSYRSAPRR